MTTMDGDPRVVTLAEDYPEAVDPHFAGENIRSGAETVAARVPVRYAGAVADHPEVRTWVRNVVDSAVGGKRGMVAAVGTGPSLVLLGSTGTGKTYQAYGAIRALALSGVQCRWLMITAADLYARLRPRSGVDSEAEFTSVAIIGVLVVDDLGAAKGSEWNEEVNYRLINYRYERNLPTLITSNVVPRELPARLGERVASRLSEMATFVALKGDDRRKA